MFLIDLDREVNCVQFQFLCFFRYVLLELSMLVWKIGSVVPKLVLFV